MDDTLSDTRCTYFNETMPVLGNCPVATYNNTMNRWLQQSSHYKKFGKVLRISVNNANNTPVLDVISIPLCLCCTQVVQQLPVIEDLIAIVNVIVDGTVVGLTVRKQKAPPKPIPVLWIFLISSLSSMLLLHFFSSCNLSASIVVVLSSS